MKKTIVNSEVTSTVTVETYVSYYGDEFDLIRLKINSNLGFVGRLKLAWGLLQGQPLVDIFINDLAGYLNELQNG